MSDTERPVRSTEALRQWHRPLDDGMCKECGHEWPCAVGHLLGEVDRLREDNEILRQQLSEVSGQGLDPRLQELAAKNYELDVCLASARKERDELRQHILDIDAHATPYGDIPDEPGWVGTYLLTAGALHRALGKIGHSAPKCQAEAEIKRLADAIMAIPGEPGSEGGAVDVAIRIIQETRSRYASSGAWAEAERLRAELAKAEEERERYRQHSIQLNSIAWRIATALGDVPEGAAHIEANPLEQTDRLIARLANPEAVADAAKACADDLRNAGYRLSDNARALITAVDALAAAEQSTPDTCASCNGARWVDDENWQPEHEGERARWRVRGSGRIPCGACNEGGWNVPDSADYETPDDGSPKQTIDPDRAFRDHNGRIWVLHCGKLHLAGWAHGIEPDELDRMTELTAMPADEGGAMKEAAALVPISAYEQKVADLARETRRVSTLADALFVEGHRSDGFHAQSGHPKSCRLCVALREALTDYASGAGQAGGEVAHHG